METASMLLQQYAAAPTSGMRRQDVDGRAALDRVAFRRARQGNGCRDLRAGGLGRFFGAGEHNSKSHEEDDDLAPARLFVGLPIDSVTDGATINSVAAVAAGIHVVRLLSSSPARAPAAAAAGSSSPARAPATAAAGVELARTRRTATPPNSGPHATARER